MKLPIFLSAGVPDRKPYVDCYDAIAIRESVLSLVANEARNRVIVFGGHPAISPLVEHAARSLGALSQIHIYQSRILEAIIPDVAKEFPNLHWTEQRGSGAGDAEASLTLMRNTMIASRSYGAAVFIGGMEGIFEEYAIFAKHHPSASIIPIASTGGAARDLFEQLDDTFSPEAKSLLKDEKRYRRLFSKLIPSE